jgi:SagB-type dehydrogenase family enzyme
MSIENLVVETATQTLHRLTCYESGRDETDPIDDPRVLQDLEVDDLARLPWFFKRYAQSLPRVLLPRSLPSTTTPAIDVLTGSADIAPSELSVPHLSRLLYLSAGVVRTMKRPYGTYLFRAAGSAGGRFPLEVYVVIPHGLALPAGVHWYHPGDHALFKVGEPPRGASAALVVTGIPWRTGWSYRERGYRHVYWDAGTMLAQVLVVADSAGLTAQLHTRFPDAAVAALVGADGIHEWPVAVVALGDDAPAMDATGAAAMGEIDAAPVEFPLVTAAQRAGECDSLGEPWDRGRPVDVSARGTDPMETVVLARGSQRRMDPTRGLPEPLLRTALGAALRGVDVPHRVVVHDVEGLDPGVYRWPDLSAPARPGAMRDELYQVSLDQGLARDAAFLVIAVTDVTALDDHEYREAQLAAGLAMGRLHLLAYGLGASASGMTFVDGDVRALLGESLDALLFTCIGVPDYASRAGGLPGAPTSVRRVEPR